MLRCGLYGYSEIIKTSIRTKMIYKIVTWYIYYNILFWKVFSSIVLYFIHIYLLCLGENIEFEHSEFMEVFVQINFDSIVRQ